MLLAQRSVWYHTLLRRRCVYRLTESVRALTVQPNIPLSLDPSLQAILRDGEMSLMKGDVGKHHVELEVIPTQMSQEDTEVGPETSRSTPERKSPAADYGSRRIGAVIIPNQLQNAINSMISEANKVQLHSDAKRLFFNQDGESGSGEAWETYYNSKRYHSRKQAMRHSERDGIAFATIALPAHYSAITSVFHHLKQRLESKWKAKHIIDWGAGAGSGLWAALHTFQPSPSDEDEAHIPGKQVSNSYILSYLGIDKREGLVALGKRLFKDVEGANLSMTWQKSYKVDNQLSRDGGHDAIALSAFMLTSLPDSRARKALVNQMWESGAHVMVLIDHNTPAGFEAIASAREYLLNMGRKESGADEAGDEPIRGSHVVAPCPHDGACPLRQPGANRLVCGFSQRIQRPSFVRKTKHSGVGHEDIQYSYVVIRRGHRPHITSTNYGRVGDVGRRALEKEALSQAPMKELKLHSEDEPIADATTEAGLTVISECSVAETESEPTSGVELAEALRLESYSWPRLVFPPLKKSGHVILDSCTAKGKIMRITIPRSQGKQAYYDARKSNWGDIFPHSPKNPPQERFQPKRKTKSDL